MQAQRGWVSRPKGAGICRLRAAKPHPPFSFPRKKTGGVTVQKKGVRLAVSGLNKPFASGMRMPARGDAAFSIAIRFASASTIRCCAAVGGFAALRMRHTPCGCRSAYLAIVQPNSRLPRHPSMRRAQQCRYFARSLPPRKRHSRLTAVRRGCKRSRIAGIHGEAMYTALTLRSACSSSSPRPAMETFLSGDLKGDTLFREREYPPFARSPRQVGETKGVHPFCFSRASRQQEFYHPP